VDGEKKEIVFHGVAASPGIAIGPALLIGGHCTSYKEPEIKTITPDKVESEIARFKKAIDKTRYEIEELQKRVQSKLDGREASIFDAHLLIVDDKMLTDEIEELVVKKLQPADYAFYTVIKRYVSALSAMEDHYIRERAADIEDVASRIISNLQGTKKPVLDHLPGQRIVLARDLTPSDTALLDRENVLGFAIESGSHTSHTAILARSMQIPAIASVRNLFDRMSNGDLLIIDGFIGTVIINPTEATQNLYALKETRKQKYYADLLKESRLRPETIDGYCIQLAGNIEHLNDISQVQLYGAAGVGLFRTEYLYMSGDKSPSEEEQYKIYRDATERMKDFPVVIRTIDLGGDKLANQITTHFEQNPFLGLRAVRLCLKEQTELFRTQLRAILRASAHGKICIMFPMITSVDEVDQVNELVQRIKDELRSEKRPFNDKIETGIMIETPAAAIIADKLAPKVDFFSIGTNDLVQYTLAVDRNNESVSYLYQPSHPAILTLIDMVVKAARKNQIWVSVCGEMASDLRYTPLLAGLGVHELSMSPVSLGTIRRIIRRMHMHEAEEVAEKAMKCSTAEEALALSEALLLKIAPDIVSLAVKGL